MLTFPASMRWIHVIMILSLWVLILYQNQGMLTIIWPTLFLYNHWAERKDKERGLSVELLKLYSHITSVKSSPLKGTLGHKCAGGFRGWPCTHTSLGWMLSKPWSQAWQGHYRWLGWTSAWSSVRSWWHWSMQGMSRPGPRWAFCRTAS